MKAITLEPGSPDSLRLDEIAEPDPQPGDLLIEVMAVGICGTDHEIIEGDWKPHRLVIFRFPSRQAIRNLFADPEYKKVAQIRWKSAKTIAVAIDGLV